MIVREVFDNGVRLITERMDHLRSVSVGVWLTRGSRDEPVDQQRHRALHRAHALQGHGHPLGRRHRAGHRLGRRPPRCVHGQGVRELLHQGARRAPAVRVGHPRRHRAPPGAAARRHRAREEGHPRRDQDGRGHAGRPRARAVHAGALGRPRARPADPRRTRDGRRVRPARRSQEFFDARTSRRTCSSSPSGTWSTRASATSSRGASARSRVPAERVRRRSRAWCRRCRCAPRSSSRATSAWASAATRSTTTTATRATSSTPCSAAR